MAHSRKDQGPQEHHARQKQGKGKDLPEMVVHPGRQEHEDDPQNRGHGLFFQKMVRISHALLGNGEAGAVNHDDPKAHQDQGR